MYENGTARSIVPHQRAACLVDASRPERFGLDSPTCERRTMPEFTRVPDDLTERDQWLLWKYERRGVTRTKVPYSIRGSKASSTDSSDWASFDAALSVLHGNPKKGSIAKFDCMARWGLLEGGMRILWLGSDAE
jgi:hypothetical protein